MSFRGSPNTPFEESPTDMSSVRTASDHGVRSLVHAIIFSKDRAFQLQQLLMSLSLHTSHARVSVLYTTSPAKTRDEGGGEEAECTDASYEDVKREFSGVNFVREIKGQFAEQFLQLLGSSGVYCSGDVDSTAGTGESAAEDDVASPFVMFLVDDIVIYDLIDVVAMVNLLTSRPDVWSVHTKLQAVLKTPVTLDAPAPPLPKEQYLPCLLHIRT
jgi:hypothetical protein